MNTAEGVARLNALQPGDNEGAHDEADAILLEFVPKRVADAWRAADERIGWWYA